jgi:two-component system cell cycle response regulator
VRSVLIIDDSPTLRRQIRAVLERDGAFGEVLEAGDGLQGFKLLVDRRPDVVLCDLVMPGIDGAKFLMMYTARADLRSIPVIMLTGEDDLSRKADILERGASDYVTKPFHDKELLARVRIQTRLKTLQDELRAVNEQLAALAITDELTGLANRRHFNRRLVEEVLRTQRYRTPLSVVLADVDHFKRVNDTHGHPMGDEVLRNTARVFAAAVRTTDTLARYGGEEIALVLPHTGADGALVLAERLRATLAATVHVRDDARVQATASFGVASVDGDVGLVTADEFIARADAALYRAKQTGRDRVVLWDASLVAGSETPPKP